MSAEYPKVIQAGAIKVTVVDADDEARWLATVPPAQINHREPEPAPEPEPVADEAPEPEPDPIPAKTAPKKKRPPKKK